MFSFNELYLYPFKSNNFKLSVAIMIIVIKYHIIWEKKHLLFVLNPYLSSSNLK